MQLHATIGTRRDESPDDSPARDRTASLVARSARLVVDDIDFAAFAKRPLDEATLRCLRYMHDVEGHTICYLRDLLLTPAHRDPDITSFLACWVYEEHWHGDAIAQVLGAHGEPAGAARLEGLRRRLGWRDQVRPLLFGAAGALRSDLPAVHMAWGAVNEWTTQAAYGRLAARSGHPVLTSLLRRIMRQEGRHIDFYAAEARLMLARRPGAQRLVRFALSRLWSPVGAGVMPPSEVRFMASHLFGGPEGREAARRVDRQVQRLPGLAGLCLLEGAVAA